MMIGRVLFVAGVLACSGGGAPRRDVTVAERSIDEVLAAHTDALMRLPGVVGIAIGLCDGERCIKVLVTDSSAALKAKVPHRLEGHRVAVEVTGTIRPRS